MSIQLIIDGRNGSDEGVELWRTGEYAYELEIGNGIYKTTLKFSNTEYYDALEQFDAAVANYTEIA